MKDIGHTFSIDNHLIPDSFIDWYVSLGNNTPTMKNDITVISKVIKNGTMNPEFIFKDDQLKHIITPVLLLWGNDDTFGG